MVLGEPSHDLIRMILTGGLQSIKFTTDRGVGCVRSDLTTNKDHPNSSKGGNVPTGDSMIDIIDTREGLHTQRGMHVEDFVKDMLEGTTKRYLQIGSSLQESLNSNLVGFLGQNLDAFAWSPSDNPRIIRR